ncbi:minor tail protein [Mycobacterium phage Antsirabe]|uniref:Minor tail protein n=1 Tax=Mycobacterium phage Antsirabe TaxID=2575610 RepID=A0A5J6TH30_9CAUD|nr:minor tail protein [Mycobacterium phage Antsirabe]QFG09975.1 hypothetical protein PBI_ANTSIRABE_21 [Mycobacterium phage Antsirabe]
MAYEKRYKTVVPIPRGPVETREQDQAIARWLARESFENTVAGDRLELVEYEERQLAVEDIPPTMAELLGAPVDSFDWFEFSGLGRLNQDQFDYFAAEFKWKCDEWLAAERAHLAALDEAAAGGA